MMRHRTIIISLVLYQTTKVPSIWKVICIEKCAFGEQEIDDSEQLVGPIDLKKYRKTVFRIVENRRQMIVIIGIYIHVTSMRKMLRITIHTKSAEFAHSHVQIFRAEPNLWVATLATL